MGKKRTAPRKLAFVIHDLNSWGGQDRSTLEIARRLSRRWPVEVYAFSLAGAGPDRLDFHKIRPAIAGPAIVRNSIFQGATLLKFGPGSVPGGDRPLVHATGTCSLVSDVVQVQFLHSAWKEMLAAMPYGLDFEDGASRHGGFREIYHRLLLDHEARLERAVYSRKKSYIAISSSVARDLERYFGITDGVRVIRHGVDAERFRPQDAASERMAFRRSLAIGENDVMLVLVGAYARKGLATAIKAVAQLPEASRARARLVAVGSGNRERFLALASGLGVASKVSLVEHTRDVTPYYQAADAFVLPTLYEPFGLVVLEAMACGLPCLVSNCSGAAELIRDGESGLLIDEPTDCDEIAAKLDRLICDRPFRARIGAAARSVAAARSWDQVADEYADFLGPMLGGSGS